MSAELAWSLGWRVVASAGLLATCFGCLIPILAFGSWIARRIEGDAPGFLRSWVGTVVAIFMSLLAELPLLDCTVPGLGLVWRSMR
jgi:hypothetical protein